MKINETSIQEIRKNNNKINLRDMETRKTQKKNQKISRKTEKIELIN